MTFRFKHLTLARPLAVIDLESTGTDPVTDRVAEVAVLTLSPDGFEDLFATRVNPGCPIPAAATAVHGIADADVRGAPAFAALAPDLVRRLAGCDLAGFGIAGFDLPLLTAECARAGVPLALTGRTVLDALAVYRRYEARTLSAAVGCGGQSPGDIAGSAPPAQQQTATPDKPAATTAVSATTAATAPVDIKPAAGTAAIVGKVKYNGEPPKCKPINFGPEKKCCDAHKTPPLDETLVVNQDRAIQWVLVRVGADVRAAIEACSGSADLAEELVTRAGWMVDLVHPGYVAQMKGNPDKSDFSDARVLADLERVGYLPKVWHAPAEVRELRRLVRYRQQLVGERRNVELRIGALLRDNRVAAPDGVNPWTVAWVTWLAREAVLSEQTR